MRLSTIRKHLDLCGREVPIREVLERRDIGPALRGCVDEQRLRSLAAVYVPWGEGDDSPTQMNAGLVVTDEGRDNRLCYGLSAACSSRGFSFLQSGTSAGSGAICGQFVVLADDEIIVFRLESIETGCQRIVVSRLELESVRAVEAWYDTPPVGVRCLNTGIEDLAGLESKDPKE